MPAPACMLRRIAGNCCWQARYLERAEHVAHVLQAAYQRDLERTGGSDAGPWPLAIAATSSVTAFDGSAGGGAAERAGAWLLHHPQNPSSAVACVRNARENARSARDVLGRAFWECVNATWLAVADLDAGRTRSDGLAAVVDDLLQRLAAVRGAAQDLPRDEVAAVLAAGAALERADAALRLLIAAAPALADGEPAIGSPAWQDLAMVLRMVGAEEPYRRRHAEISPHGIAAFLIGEARLPRSLAAAIAALRQAIAALPGDAAEPAAATQRLAMAAAAIDAAAVGGGDVTTLIEALDAAAELGLCLDRHLS